MSQRFMLSVPRASALFPAQDQVLDEATSDVRLWAFDIISMAEMQQIEEYEAKMQRIEELQDQVQRNYEDIQDKITWMNERKGAATKCACLYVSDSNAGRSPITVCGLATNTLTVFELS